jgi:DNA-binding SARP family transcriptional activator
VKRQAIPAAAGENHNDPPDLRLPDMPGSVLDARRTPGVSSARQVETGTGSNGRPAVGLLRQIPSSSGGPGEARLRPSFRLFLLDGFELRDRTGPLPVPLSAQRVLAFVALHEHPVLRRYVASKLWVESTEEHATSSLRSSLWRLRHAGCYVMEVAGPRLRLSPEVGVDVREATAWCRGVLEDETCVDVNGTDRHVPFGELLPDWYDDWVLFERERLRELRASALEALCERLIGRGSLVEAMQIAQEIVKLEPLRESAHRQLIRIHLADGNQSEAVRAYGLFSALLRAELGLRPSAKMEQVMASLAGNASRPHAARTRTVTETVTGR